MLSSCSLIGVRAIGAAEIVSLERLKKWKRNKRLTQSCCPTDICTVVYTCNLDDVLSLAPSHDYVYKLAITVIAGGWDPWVTLLQWQSC